MQPCHGQRNTTKPYQAVERRHGHVKIDQCATVWARGPCLPLAARGTSIIRSIRRRDSRTQDPCMRPMTQHLRHPYTCISFRIAPFRKSFAPPRTATHHCREKRQPQPAKATYAPISLKRGAGSRTVHKEAGAPIRSKQATSNRLPRPCRIGAWQTERGRAEQQIFDGCCAAETLWRRSKNQQKKRRRRYAR